MEYTVDNLNQANDYIINKLVNSSDNFDPKIIEAAKIIYSERDLGSKEKQLFISRYDELKDQVKSSLANGESEVDQVSFLTKNGFSYHHATNLIEHLSDGIKDKEKEKFQNKSAIYFLIFCLLMLFKYIFNKVY